MIKEIFIKRKLDLIQNDLAHLVPLSKFSFEEISQDFMKQATVERVLERIINRAIDINQHLIFNLATIDTEPPLDYTETFLKLAEFGIYSRDFAQEISKSIGTRNVLSHEYDKTDQQKIYSSMFDCVRDYNQYCGYILEFLDKNLPASRQVKNK